MLVRVFDGDEVHSVLFDAGGSPQGAVINARRMGINLTEVECIVLSHGHYDHFVGLPAAGVRVIKKSGLPIIVHSDMFKKRGVSGSDGIIRKYPDFPSEDRVKPVKYIETKQPCLIANDLILITGEIPRNIPFENGYPQHRTFIGRWEPDPWIRDDRALIVNVRRKGLAILSGCSHAGIINTILYAQHLTGVKTVYAVLGGLHLAGKEFEGRISRTVEELKTIGPQLLSPSHYTGWRANYVMLRDMPYAFVWDSVGNLYAL
ncbi:MBL fold metallo-hydrolase [Candidatus Bathyarchaeota archaeon]|nr:MBL fold metallo-hydrolase [Candidatus Bathyarchaeota archaeon]